MKTRCRKCNIIFENNGILGLNKCPDCLSPYEGQNKAQIVRDLVKDNPGISASEVSSMTGISTREIIDYLRIEVLEFTNDSLAYLKCEKCGAEIRTGKYCSSCKSKYQHVVKMSPTERYRFGKMY